MKSNVFNSDNRHITKDYKKLKKEQDTKKCYKYEKIRYITKNYRIWQKIKN